MIALLLGLLLHLVTFKTQPVISPVGSLVLRPKLLAAHEFSLSKRYEDSFVNHVFRENILLTLAYMRKVVNQGKPIDWSLVDRPFHWVLTIAPGEAVSYHAGRLPQFREALPLTELYFNGAEGFLSDGWLVGDGTCHLASLLAWAARDAGLIVTAPTNHDFAVIPEVPRSEGVSIFSQPQNPGGSALQNLYIQNNFGKSVQFVFDYSGDTLKISVFETASTLATLAGLGSQF